LIHFYKRQYPAVSRYFQTRMLVRRAVAQTLLKRANSTPVLTSKLSKGALTSSHTSTVRCISTKVALDHSKRRLALTSPTGTTEEYPWVWLRDNCQSESSYEKLAQSRIVNLSEFDINTAPVKAQIVDGQLEVEWDDGHQSVYGYDWLMERSFRLEQRQKFKQSLVTKNIVWGGEMQGSWPTADYATIMNSDQGLLSWLEDLDRYGFVLVQNVPVEEGPVPDLQKRVGFERLTHYGPGYTVKVRPNPSNVSYTHHRIFFHTDLTYYDHMPGTVFLHCIQQHQGKGGETMLADGFKAAEILKSTQPDKYRLLAETVTYFKDIGTDYIKYNKINQANIFVHDIRGDLCRINWSHFARDSFLDADIDQVDAIYAAMRAFDDTLNNPENHIRLKMQPGDMVTVKNQRILHGRSELEGGISGRHLQCGYMDWDEIKSSIRVLRANQAQQ